MTEAFKQQIETEARQAVTELLAQANLKKGDMFVVGCSSSEIGFQSGSRAGRVCGHCAGAGGKRHLAGSAVL